MPKLPLFDEVYEMYTSMVYNLALHYVQNALDAQDITQEVFIKIYHNLHKVDESKASLKTWIYRITINHCLDFIKTKNKGFGFFTSLFRSGNDPQQYPHDFHHSGVALEDKEALQELFVLINQLPPNQKTALILSKIEGRGQKEVAEIMNMSVKAVDSLVQRAKQTLSKKISNNK